MSEPILRRSSRNATKKNVLVAPPPAPVGKKRAPDESKIATSKKTKTTTDNAIPLEATAANLVEAASSSKPIPSPEKFENTEKPTKATSKSAGKPTAKSAALKSFTNLNKARRTDEMSEGLKDGDLVPTDLPEIQTENGTNTTLESLLKNAQKGIIIFAYPRASTPGCIAQACLFRDSFTAFSDAGYTVYGLSGDTPATNEKFKSKHTLSYTLLCDPTYELHERLSIKKKPKGTIRSIVIIEKISEDGYAGKVLRISPASPPISLQIAKEAVGIDHASIIAAAAAAKELEQITPINETNLPISIVSVDVDA